MPTSSIRLFVLGLALVATACSSLSTSHDYDADVDFTALSTYAWMDSPEPDSQYALVLRRAVRDVDEVLAAKGFRLDPAAPDFLIATHVGTEDKVSITDWGYAYPSRYGSFSTRDIDVRNYTEGTLVFDFVQADSKTLIWRGSATRTIDPSSTPEERTERVREAVEAILAPFPPGAGE